jgi:hypothetical protein
MNKDSNGKRIAGSLQRDQIGKVFLVVSTDGLMLQRCLVCEQAFPRKACAEHSMIPCTPGIERSSSNPFDSR